MEEILDLGKQLLDDVYDWAQKNVLPKVGEPAEKYEYAWEAVRGGKGLRPLATYLAAETFGIDPKTTIPVCVAEELGQAAMTVFDDIQDEGIFRRGKKTLYRIVGIGYANTIAADLLIRSIAAVNTARPQWGDKTDQILKILTEMYFATGDGQTREHLLKKKPLREITKEDYVDVATEKAGDYTIGVPYAAAAILANSPMTVVNDYRTFGRILGVSFQITDDVLNKGQLLKLMDDSETYKLLQDKKIDELENLDEEQLSRVLGKYGKEPGGDFVEPKPTMDLIDFVTRADEADFRLIDEVYDKRKTATYEKMFRLTERERDAGSLDFAQKYALETKTRAEGLLKEKLPESPAREKLFRFNDIIVRRSY